jgi:hypothetical protein
MENKIHLYDANDVKIGETFSRRARQLVSQQRAEWVDEAKTAIRFAPDAEEGWETGGAEPLPPAAEPASLKTESAAKEGLYMIAERRIRERNRFALHSTAFIPVGLFLLILFDGIYRSNGFLLFILGGWVTAYGIHFIHFVMNYANNSLSVKERRLRKLAAEVERLKRMGY